MRDSTNEQPRPDEPPSRRPQLSDAQQQRVLRTAALRVEATVRRTEPEEAEPLLGEVAGLPLLGAFVTLRRAGQLRSCCGYLSDDIPLSEALTFAATRAAKDDPRFPPIAPEELDSLDMDVWLLWNLERVPGRGAERVNGFEVGVHGLQISKSNARGLLLPGVAVEHRFDAEEFLRQTCRKARLPADAWLEDDTLVERFEGFAIEGRLTHCLQPEAVASDPPAAAPVAVSSRPPAWAGQFYPGDPSAIEEALDDMLAETLDEGAQRAPWAGALVPHAGWIYSGSLVARVLGQVEIPKLVIIVAPKHRPQGAAWAVAPHDIWALPGGEVASDADLARRLANAVTGLELDAAAHRLEHAIEVELPFVARLAPQTRVVGITVHGGDLASLQQFGRQLADALSPLPDAPLLVVSSDMSHVRTDAEARRADRMALDAMAALDPAGLYEAVTGHGITMCGFRPAVIVMEALRQLGSLKRSELVGYRTSAETAPDAGRTVGYAGILFA